MRRRGSKSLAGQSTLDSVGLSLLIQILQLAKVPDLAD